MAEIIVLSDKEFYEMKNKEKRDNFLKDLEKMSKPSKGHSGFSVKDIKKEEEKPIKSEIDDGSISSYLSSNPITEADESEWGDFVADLSQLDMSPIETITDETITGFKLDPDVVEPDENKYGKVFKKEIAMLSEVLKDVKAHGSRVDSALKKMNIGGKGSSSRVTGIPKGYSDLVEAYNSINTTKIQVIKAMSDLRSKQIDWQFKDKANSPAESESVDNIADSYYKKIIGGGTQNFINNSMSSYQQTDFEYDSLLDTQDDSGDPSTIDSLVMGGAGFNITQPIKGSKSYMDSGVIGDEYGYIANENKNYEIVAYQYGDNRFQLGALDDDGESLEDIELPTDNDPDIVDSLKIRPGSNFVYDKYGRSYRVIEMGNVDISDVDDMDYPY